MRQVTGYTEQETSEIKEKYPKFCAELKEWVLDMQGMKEFLDATPDIAKSVDVIADMCLLAGLRDLYDFFDERNIMCEVQCSKTMGYCGGFMGQHISIWKNNRIDAEKELFLQVIEYYEKMNEDNGTDKA